MALALGTNAKNTVVSPSTNSKKKKTAEESINTYVAPAYVIPQNVKNSTPTPAITPATPGKTPSTPTPTVTTPAKTTSTPSKSTSSTPAATTTAPTLSLPTLYELPGADGYGTRPELGVLPGVYQLPGTDSYGTRPVLGALPSLYEMPGLDSYGTRPEYQQSQAVQNAYDTYQQYLASKPGAYESNYQAQIDTLLNDILNRPAFSYDFTADPLYQQYRDSYVEQGRQAMLDATANAAALTGGYANSYAAAAGQQAYQAHLQNLNNVIPELWEMAYSVYLNEGNDRRSDMNLLQTLENMDYGRYRDTVDDWQIDRDFAYNAYNREYDRDYGMYRDEVGDWEDDRNFAYNADLNKYNASVAERDFAYQQYRDSVSDWESDRAFDYSADMDRYNASIDARDFAYQQYLDSVANWEADRAFNYGADMDRYNASVDERDFAYQQYLDALNQYNYENEFAYQQAQDALALASRSGGGSSSKSDGYSDIAKGVKNFSGATALEYLDSAVNEGIISPEQADYLATINGITYGNDGLTFGANAKAESNFDSLPGRVSTGTGSTASTSTTTTREEQLRKRIQAGTATPRELDEYDRLMNSKKG